MLAGPISPGGGFESVLENRESTIFEVECRSGRRFCLEVALIENALVIAASFGLELISFYGWLSGVTIPKLAVIMPLVVGIPRKLLVGQLPVWRTGHDKGSTNCPSYFCLLAQARPHSAPPTSSSVFGSGTAARDEISEGVNAVS